MTQSPRAPIARNTPNIAVIGVGGGGGNAINNMIDRRWPYQTGKDIAAGFVFKTPFFYGLADREEVSIGIDKGKTLVVRQTGRSEGVDDEGKIKVFFELNGQPRTVRVPKAGIVGTGHAKAKAEEGNANHVGAPMPGMVVTVATAVAAATQRAMIMAAWPATVAEAMPVITMRPITTTPLIRLAMQPAMMPMPLAMPPGPTRMPPETPPVPRRMPIAMQPGRPAFPAPMPMQPATRHATPPMPPATPPAIRPTRPGMRPRHRPMPRGMRRRLRPIVRRRFSND